MGDDAPPEQQGADRDGFGTRRAPRHAARRKTLLTWANASAGKIIAMAAMPTAVLMGMGLTPHLASADELPLPKNPFSGDSCISQSDSPSPSPSASTAANAANAANATNATNATNTTSVTSNTLKAPTSLPSPLSNSKPPSSGSGAGNPLSLGGALPELGNALTPAPPTPSSGGNLLGSVTKSAGKTTTSVTSAAKGVTSSVTTTVLKADPALPAARASSPKNGTPYPCPTYNAKALADAGLEQTPELLPDQPWVLKSSLLTLTGLDYHGIVKVKTENGSVKDVLKFTATAVDIKDLHQIVDAPDGTFQHVKAAPGSTSTFRDGTVTMYTQELKGNLFGLIPVTFSPDSPPPVNVPFVCFTNATVTQAGQFGGTLTIPGMNGYGSTSPE